MAKEKKDTGRPADPRAQSEIARWDLQTDVVVVGLGGAGCCAAGAWKISCT